jgi:hypothetical protein
MKTAISFIFKLLVFSLTALGVYLTVKDSSYPLEVFSYYTTVVNVFTILLFALLMMLMVVRKNPSPLVRFFKQSLMVQLIITLFIYSFVLIPYITEQQIDYQIFSIEDVIIHYITPLIVILDYAWFDEKGKFKAGYSLTNLLNLLAYVLYLTVYVFFGGRFHSGGTTSIYPYFFLNIENVGLQPFIFICLAIIAVVVFIGWVVYMVDQLLGVTLALTPTKRK